MRTEIPMHEKETKLRTGAAQAEKEDIKEKTEQSSVEMEQGSIHATHSICPIMMTPLPLCAQSQLEVMVLRPALAACPRARGLLLVPTLRLCKLVPSVVCTVACVPYSSSATGELYLSRNIFR
jgi:hypothetical protein